MRCRTFVLLPCANQLTLRANWRREQAQFLTMKNADVSRVDALPTATGGIARAAFALAAQAGCDVETLLKFSGLSLQQIKDPSIRIGVRTQIKFLNLAADALKDDSLGVHLAQHFDLR